MCYFTVELDGIVASQQFFNKFNNNNKKRCTLGVVIAPIESFVLPHSSARCA